MVANDGGISSSDPVDPLVGYDSLSLFPLSFNPKISTNVDDVNPKFPTIDSLHSHLKTMVLNSPEKLLKQAKVILDDSSNLVTTDKASAMVSEDKTEADPVVNEKYAKEKRPALGLKRAKFSAKPMPSQPDVMSEPSIDIDKLDDPEEFFAAFERMENATKELQKLRGQPLTDLDQNISSLPPRRRRPSLLGKSATYKHHSYSSTANIDDSSETLLASQETLLSPIRQDVLSETDAVNISPKARVSGSASMDTRNLNELDELLSCDYEGLDEAGVVNLVQDKLDFKIGDIGKTSLPDLCDIRPRKSVSSDEALPKIIDSISRLNGIRKAGGKSLVMSSQPREGSVQSQISPALPKSPLASISFLNKRISKLTPVKDPFSAIDIDSSPVSSPPEIQQENQSDLGDARMNEYESWRSLVHEEESTVVSRPVLATNGKENGIASGSQPDKAGTGKDLYESEKSTAPGEESITICGMDSPILAVDDIAPTSEPKEFTDVVGQSDQVGTREDLCEQPMRSPAHRDDRVADHCEDSLVIAEKDADPTSEAAEAGDSVHRDDRVADPCEDSIVIAERDADPTSEVAKTGDSVQQIHNVEGSSKEKSISSGGEGCGVGEASNAEDSCTEELTKETGGSTKRKLEEVKNLKDSLQPSPSQEAVKKGRKTKTLIAPVSKETGNKKRKVDGVLAEPCKRKELRRHSLYEAGTKWEAGLRRSSRIRMRPLEYWRGERFLYGRVHNSLVTVIGVKYASPSKEAEQPAVKVKSFVSDDYKELVDLAALH